MKTLISIKVDKEAKEQAQRLAKKLGLPLSTIVNAYLKEMIRKQEIHFSILPRPKEFAAVIREARMDFRKRQKEQ